jgi:hypothetical protein
MTAANRILKSVWGIITIGRGVVLKEQGVERTWGATELVEHHSTLSTSDEYSQALESDTVKGDCLV